MPNYDGILILGGGVREGGELTPWAEARFDLALELEDGEPLVCLSAGTTHRPPPLEDGFPITESLAGARYLMRRGVAPERIRMESVSYDTIGNAYFSKLLHVDPPAWRHLLVITSEFHMTRTREIFEWVYGFGEAKYLLDFAAAPNRGLSEQAAQFRIEKETQAMQALSNARARVSSLAELYEWIWTAHKAYSAAGRWKQERSRDPRVIESY
jgi:hypothetical protein